MAVLAFFGVQVHAVGIGNDNPPSTGGNVRIDNEVRTNAAAFVATNQKQKQTNIQNVTVNPVATPVTVNPQGATVNLDIQEGSRDVLVEGRTGRNTPSIGLGNVYPTAPCMGSSQVGGSGVGFSIGVGTSWTDDECGIRETARSFASLDLKGDAVKVLCTSKYAAVADACKKD